MKSNAVKGYLYALIATLAFSNVYIFSKAALNEVHLTQFGVYWFAIGGFLTFIFAWKNKDLKQVKHLTKKQVKILLSLGVLEMLTTTTFFISINVISNPAVTSFLGNMYPVMVTIGGVLILKEKFGIIEIIGILMAFTGAFIISYSGGETLSTFFIKGTGWVFINAFFATVATIIVKVHVKNMSPGLINLNRNFWLLLLSVVMIIVYKQSLVIPVSAFKNIAIGAILGPFLAILTIYYSFKFIEASRSSIIQSLKGIFVLIGAYLVFKTFPLPHQFAGGIISVFGVMLMTMAQAGMFNRFKSKKK